MAAEHPLPPPCSHRRRNGFMNTVHEWASFLDNRLPACRAKATKDAAKDTAASGYVKGKHAAGDAAEYVSDTANTVTVSSPPRSCILQLFGTDKVVRIVPLASACVPFLLNRVGLAMTSMLDFAPCRDDGLDTVSSPVRCKMDCKFEAETGVVFSRGRGRQSGI